MVAVFLTLKKSWRKTLDHIPYKVVPGIVCLTTKPHKYCPRNSSKQSFYVERKDGQSMAFAGMWEHWEDRDLKEKIESCTLLTTNANEEVSLLHDRMPVILEPESFGLWLDPAENRPKKLQPLLKPAADGVLYLRPVSRYVNSPANEGEKCVEEV